MEGNQIHPLVNQAQDELRQGKISRRDFLKFSTLLGASLATAKFLASCASPTEVPAAAPVASAATAVPAATVAPKASIVRGGTLTCATRVERVDNPATFSLVSASHPCTAR